MAVYIKEEKTLFLGDALGPNLYAPAPYYSAGIVQKLLARIRSFPVDWYVEGHCEPERPERFWAENRVLEITATLIQKGVTQRATLLQAVEQQASPHPPHDRGEVIDYFLNAPRHPEAPLEGTYQNE